MSVTYLGYRLAQQLSTSLPRGVAFRCAEQLADLQWRWSSNDRAVVEANLSVLLGKPISAKAPLVRDVFRNFGRYIVEFFSVQRLPQPEVRVEGYDHLSEALRRRQGGIALTAHVGNWEVGAALMHRMGLPMTAVALPHGDPRMDRLFNHQRERCGVQVIPLGRDAARRSLQSLREGRVLGLLGDREFSGNGIRVPFCGREVVFPRGPALLSLRSHVPAVPTFLIREGSWKFRLCLEPPIWPQTQEVTEASVRALTQAYAAIFEQYLKQFPDQWLMFQPMTK